jgi:hypothetical protein
MAPKKNTTNDTKGKGKMMDTESTSSHKNPGSAFRVQPQPAQPPGFLIAIMTLRPSLHRAQVEIETLFLKSISPAESMQPGVDIEFIFDEYESVTAQSQQRTNVEESKEPDNLEQPNRSSMAISRLLVRYERMKVR